MSTHYDDELRRYKRNEVTKERVFVNVTPIVRWLVKKLRWLFRDLY